MRSPSHKAAASGGRPPRPPPPRGPVAVARRALLEGVGAEVAASFPGITRLGGQIVAALYLAEEPRSMDDLSLELGRSKSNIFANLRGLEAAGIVERQRASGARHDRFALRGKYPDVIIGAYIARLRRVATVEFKVPELAHLSGQYDVRDMHVVKAGGERHHLFISVGNTVFSLNTSDKYTPVRLV